MRVLVIALLVAVAATAAPPPHATAAANPTVSVSDAVATETTVCSDAISMDSLVFVVSLSEPTDHQVRVGYELLTHPTASDDDVFSYGTSGTVRFPAGETTREIEILVAWDYEREPTEQVVLHLTAASGARIADDRGIGTIHDDDEPRLYRAGGETRIETALAVAERSGYRISGYGPPVAPRRRLVIARADDPADALAAVPLTVALGADLLLTASDSLHPKVRAEVDPDIPTSVVLLGGEQAIAAAVEDELRALGADVDRLAGGDRHDTARLIAERLGATRDAYLVRSSADGTGWPDAVSVSGLAGYQRRPVLLTERDALPAPTLAALRFAHVEHVTIVGGTDVVSEEVVTILTANGFTVSRISGEDRYDTSAEVAERAGDADVRRDLLWVASGLDWPDALTAGAAAAAGGEDCQTGPGWLVLVDPNDLGGSPATQQIIERLGDTIVRAWIAGGEAAVSATVERQLRDLIGIQ